MTKKEKNVSVYRVVLAYAVFAIDVDEKGRVVEAAPIAKWMKGKTLNFVKKWIYSKGGEIENLKIEVCQ